MHITKVPLWHELPNAPPVGTILVHHSVLEDGCAHIHTVAPQGAQGDNPQAPHYSVLLLRSGQEIKAWVNRCAHFGVPLARQQQQLIFTPHTSISCNVHYSRYRWSDGVCDKGECVGESLIAIPTELDAQGYVRIV